MSDFSNLHDQIAAQQIAERVARTQQAGRMAKARGAGRHPRRHALASGLHSLAERLDT